MYRKQACQKSGHLPWKKARPDGDEAIIGGSGTGGSTDRGGIRVGSGGTWDEHQGRLWPIREGCHRGWLAKIKYCDRQVGIWEKSGEEYVLVEYEGIITSLNDLPDHVLEEILAYTGTIVQKSQMRR